MKYPIVSHVETGYDGDGVSPLDLRHALVNDRSRVAAAWAVGVD